MVIRPADVGHPARRTDPRTSHKAADEVARFTAHSQQAQLLKAYCEEGRPMISEEANAVAGIHERANHWKRAGDLHRAGLLTDTGEVRKSSLGKDNILYRATFAGIKKARELGLIR